MGINITEIGQKVLDNNTNAANVFRKMYDLHYNPNPLDVPFEYIDENGNKITTNIPNVANFRKSVWDDVGAALGQFYRIFYVDQVNGDDNNAGTLDQPLQTINAAIAKTPVAGVCRIYLIGDYTIEGTADKKVFIGNKKYVSIYGVDTDTKLYLKNYGVDPITLFTKAALTLRLDVECSNEVDDNLRQSIGISYNSFLITSTNAAKVTAGVDDTKLNITIGDNSQFAYVRNSNAQIEATNFTTTDTNSYLASVGFVAQMMFNSLGATINGDAYSPDLLKSLIRNITYDADSGNPINLLCNYNLSN